MAGSGRADRHTLRRPKARPPALPFRDETSRTGWKSGRTPVACGAPRASTSAKEKLFKNQRNDFARTSMARAARLSRSRRDRSPLSYPPAP